MRPPKNASTSRESSSNSSSRQPRGVADSRVVCAIPARLASNRLPEKVLIELAGRPMIEHVYERASQARSISEVVVLTDHMRVKRAVEQFGGRCEMTPTDCASGTDRVAFAARDWNATAIINVQGDEPLLDPGDVERLALHLLHNPSEAMVTLAAPATEDELQDPDTVKVVTDAQGRALYFSRAPIPYSRGSDGAAPLRHIGIYGYRRDVLLQLAQLERTPLEQRESLEQLRALENGIPIRVLETAHSGLGVDTEADLRRVELLLTGSANRSRQSPCH